MTLHKLWKFWIFQFLFRKVSSLLIEVCQTKIANIEIYVLKYQQVVYLAASSMP